MITSGLTIAVVSQALFKVFMALFVVVAMTRLLIYLNKKTGNRFDETLAEASHDARLVYFAARLVGFAILMGFAVS